MISWYLRLVFKRILDTFCLFVQVSESLHCKKNKQICGRCLNKHDIYPYFKISNKYLATFFGGTTTTVMLGGLSFWLRSAGDGSCQRPAVKQMLLWTGHIPVTMQAACLELPAVCGVQAEKSKFE